MNEIASGQNKIVLEIDEYKDDGFIMSPLGCDRVAFSDCECWSRQL